VYYVRGDIGPATGNLEFVGSVSITGGVGTGYRVRAAGDIEIQGGVEGGNVEAGGNISIRYGIRGNGDQVRVMAAGVVRAKFIEYAVVKAGGSVYATDGIIQSSVEAGGKVEVLGNRGSIVGGRVTARESVSARDLGSPNGIPTEVVVGAAPALVAEAHQIPAREATLVQQLKKVQQRVLLLQGQDRQGTLTPQGGEELQKFELVYTSLLRQHEELAERHEELAELLRSLRGAMVMAVGTCHAEVRVTVGASTRLIREVQRGVRFERNLKTYEVDLIGLAGV
jgi:uncharacterized protein (DUF342 family)